MRFNVCKLNYDKNSTILFLSLQNSDAYEAIPLNIFFCFLKMLPTQIFLDGSLERPLIFPHLERAPVEKDKKGLSKRQESFCSPIIKLSCLKSSKRFCSPRPRDAFQLLYLSGMSIYQYFIIKMIRRYI